MNPSITMKAMGNHCMQSENPREIMISGFGICGVGDGCFSKKCRLMHYVFFYEDHDQVRTRAKNAKKKMRR